MGTQLNKQGTTNKEYKLLYCDSKVHVLRVQRSGVRHQTAEPRHQIAEPRQKKVSTR